VHAPQRWRVSRSVELRVDNRYSVSSKIIFGWGWHGQLPIENFKAISHSPLKHRATTVAQELKSGHIWNVIHPQSQGFILSHLAQ
jgi:hypothetical protein